MAWAKEIGFFPQGDYRFCSGIFQGIPVDESATFHFGQGEDGTPFFINGPHDTPQRVRQIMSTLQAYEARTGKKTLFMLGGTGGAARRNPRGQRGRGYYRIKARQVN